MSKAYFAFLFLRSEEDKRAIEFRFGVLLYEVTAYAVPDENLGPTDSRTSAMVVRPAAFDDVDLPDEAAARAWVEAEQPGILDGDATVVVREVTIPGRPPSGTEIAPFLLKDIIGDDTPITARAVILSYEVS